MCYHRRHSEEVNRDRASPLSISVPVAQYPCIIYISLLIVPGYDKIELTLNPQVPIKAFDLCTVTMSPAT